VCVCVSLLLELRPGGVMANTMFSYICTNVFFIIKTLKMDKKRSLKAYKRDKT